MCLQIDFGNYDYCGVYLFVFRRHMSHSLLYFVNYSKIMQMRSFELMGKCDSLPL